MNQKRNYASPKVKVVSFKVEHGFATSNGKFTLTETENESILMENASSNVNEQFTEDNSWFSAF